MKNSSSISPNGNELYVRNGSQTAEPILIHGLLAKSRNDNRILIALSNGTIQYANVMVSATPTSTR